MPRKATKTKRHSILNRSAKMAHQLIANLPILMLIIITLLLHSLEAKRYNCTHSVAHRVGKIPDALIASMKVWDMKTPESGKTESLECQKDGARGCITFRCKNAADGYDDWVANGCGWKGDDSCSEVEMNKNCPNADKRECASCPGDLCNSGPEYSELQLPPLPPPPPPPPPPPTPPLRIELMAFDAEAGSGETRGGGGGAVIPTVLLLFGVLLVHWM